MSEPQLNPYRATAHAENFQPGWGIWKLIQRACVAVYGMLLAFVCIVGTALEIWTGEPLLETAFWFLVGALMVYGVFALAISELRIRSLGPIWRQVTIGLAAITLFGTSWDIYSGPSMSRFELFAGLAAVAVFITPALVFNWMVGERMYAACAQRSLIDNETHS
ncbi:MAG: hypothetical protein AAF802_04475 [Planctomycetota bacterium]